MSHVVLRETGQRLEEFITMITKLSSSGSMKKINSELSPCNKAPTSSKSSRDFPSLLVKLKRKLNSLMMNILVISLTAQPILEQVSELPFTSTFQNS